MLQLFIAIIVIVFMALFIAMSLPMLRERGRVTHRNQAAISNKVNDRAS